MNKPGKDQVFAKPLDKSRKFVFNDEVASVFPDMIRRSVPGYENVISLSGQVARRFAQTGTKLYDLGCSLGATSIAMAEAVHKKDCEIIAVDNSNAMILRLTELLSDRSNTTPITPIYGDLQSTPINTASVVAMNYTLQFVPLPQREELLKKIRLGMVDDGALILSEKITFEDPNINKNFINLYHDFKRANGYSEMEISQKRDALEKVLIPETLQTQKQRLRKVGFRRVETWFQCFNFCSMLAFA